MMDNLSAAERRRGQRVLELVACAAGLNATSLLTSCMLTVWRGEEIFWRRGEVDAKGAAQLGPG